MRPGFIQHGFLFVLTVLAAASVCHATAPNAVTVDSVLRQAKALRLAEHESWYALLHYKRETVTQRFISQADDERFFLDKNGKHDAHAELVANIKAFFRDPESNHAQCLFPARWWWLKQQLSMPDDNDVHCPQFEGYMLRGSHDKLFLAFPTMYLNNPGSTFGHTFLRFDASDESILLSRTLNYAASVDKSDDIVSYVSKGLFGGYRGIFRIKRYFKTVQEYSNIENRDIWEYQLDFTPDEIEQLQRHVWEVKDIDFDYYFFKENCSYRLLALLDVIRPGMQLTTQGQFPVYAIPVDTVRALEDAGLIKPPVLRASLATQINDYFATENKGVSATALKITSQKTPADKAAIRQLLNTISAETDKLEVLRQSFNILQFYGKSSSAKAQHILLLINELSQPSMTTEKIELALHNDSAPVTPSLSPAMSPEEGHDSIRVAAGYGEQNSRFYVDLRFRPAFHDLLDAPGGYVDGAAINVLDTHLKWFDGNKLRLESLSFFNVTSLSPLRRWQKPVSWLLDFRFDRTQLSKSQSARNFISRGGAGFSFRKYGFTPYMLLMGEWNLSSSYDEGYSLLLGLQAGLHFNAKANQFMLSYEKDNAVAGFDLDRTISQLQWQYNLQINHALRLRYKRTEYNFFNDEDWSVGYNYYF